MNIEQARREATVARKMLKDLNVRFAPCPECNGTGRCEKNQVSVGMTRTAYASPGPCMRCGMVGKIMVKVEDK